MIPVKDILTLIFLICIGTFCVIMTIFVTAKVASVLGL